MGLPDLNHPQKAIYINVLYSPMVYPPENNYENLGGT